MEKEIFEMCGVYRTEDSPRKQEKKFQVRVSQNLNRSYDSDARGRILVVKSSGYAKESLPVSKKVISKEVCRRNSETMITQLLTGSLLDCRAKGSL